jgi:hypothetical protein
MHNTTVQEVKLMFNLFSSFLYHWLNQSVHVPIAPLRALYNSCPYLSITHHISLYTSPYALVPAF